MKQKSGPARRKTAARDPVERLHVDRMRKSCSIRLRISRSDSKLTHPVRHVRIGSCPQPPRCAQPEAIK